MPRWLFFMAGAFPAAGAALLLISFYAPPVSQPMRLTRFMTRTGGIVIATSIVVGQARQA